MFLATGICIIASVQFENVLAWTGPNLSSSQAIVYAQPPQNGPDATPLIGTQLAEVSSHVSGFAASLHARSAVPLESASATLHQLGAQAHKDFTGTVYVATPQLLATYGSRLARSLPASMSLPCGQEWPACRTWCWPGATTVSSKVPAA